MVRTILAAMLMFSLVPVGIAITVTGWGGVEGATGLKAANELKSELDWEREANRNTFLLYPSDPTPEAIAAYEELSLIRQRSGARLRVSALQETVELRASALKQVAFGLAMAASGIVSAFWFRRRWKNASKPARRIVAVWIGALFLVAMCMYRPATATTVYFRGRTVHEVSYGWLWESTGSIDLKRLFVQMMAVAVPVSAVLFALRGQTDPKAPE